MLQQHHEILYAIELFVEHKVSFQNHEYIKF